MATVDNLEIQIEGSANKANNAIDSLIKNLNRLTNSLKIDTSGLEKIGKSINTSGITNSAKTITTQTKQISRSFDEIAEKYKDLGKGFRFAGPTAAIQKQIDSYTNSLERAKLKKEELEVGGKTGGQGYEDVIRDIQKYENIIENLKNQFAETQEVKIDTKEIENTENLIKRMKNHIRQSMEGARIENPINLASLSAEDLSKFSQLKAEMEKISQSAKNTGEEIKKNLSPISKITFDKSAMEAVFGEMTSGIENWSQATQRFGKNYSDVLNNASIKTEEFKEKIEKTQKQTGKTETIKKLGQGLNSLSGIFGKLSRSGSVLNKSLSRMQTGFRSLFRSIVPILGIRQLFNWGKEAIETASGLTEVQNVVVNTFGQYADKLESLADQAIESLGMSKLSTKEIASKFQAMGVAMGFSAGKMSDMSIELTKLAGDMASFYNVSSKDVAKSLESIFTSQTRPLRQYGIDLTQATLQEWALKNGLDANVQSMSQAEKTLLRYQYVLANTANTQGDFARTANTWANQVRILKELFRDLGGAIGTAFINILKPVVTVLNNVLKAVTKFAENVVNALGVVFGWKIEIQSGFINDMAEDAEDLSSGIGGATGNAKKLNKELQKGIRSFDELKMINLLDEPTSGTGGGGGTGAGAGGDVSNNALKVNLKESEGLFKSSIKNLEQLGEYVGQSLINAMNNINWNSVYESARNFGTGLADFLNGLISPELFGTVGKTIANSLNTAIYSVLSFGKKIDFKEFGLSIVEGINQFFENFDFNALAETLNVWATGIWTTIKTALFGDENKEGGIDFSGIIEKIRKFFKELEPIANTFLTIFAAPIVLAGISKIITGILGIADAVAKVSALFAEGGTFAGITSIFGEGGALAGISAGPIIAIIAAITAFSLAIVDAWNTSEDFRNAVSNAFQTVKDSISNAFESIKEKLEPLGKSIKKLGENFYSFYQNSGLQDLVAQLLTWDAQLKGLEMSIVIDAITEALKFMITQLTGVIDFLSGLFEILDGIFSLDFNKISEGFETLAKGLFEAILGQTPDEFAEKIVDFFTKINWGEIAGNILIGIENITAGLPIELFNLLLDALADIGDEISQSFSDVGMYGIAGFFKGISENLRTSANWIRDTFNKLFIQPIKDFFGIHSPSTLFAELGKYIIEGLKVGILSSIQIVIDIFKYLWEMIKSIWIVASSWFNEKVIIPIAGFFQGLRESVSGFFINLWEDIKAIWATVSEWFNTNVIVPVIDFFHSIWISVSGFFANLWINIKSIWESVSSWFNNTIIKPVSNSFKIACNAIGKFFSDLWRGIKKGVAGAMNSVISGIESAINWIVKGINGIIGGFNKIVTVSAKIVGTNWSGVSQLSRVTLGRINVSGYEAGGFPEQYSLFMAGEKGKAEILGTVGGKTAVAGGEEITGIRDAIYQTSQQEIQLLKEQNGHLQAIVQKEFSVSQNDVGKAARNYAKEYFNRTGNEAYIF